MSQLKKAIYVLLFDSIDTADLEVNSDDEYFIENIVELLIKNNGLTCPYKNYGLEMNCPNTVNCKDGSCNIDCNQAAKKVWMDFIGIKYEEGDEKYEHI